LTSIERIARGFPLKPVSDPVVARGDIGRQALLQCEELGETVATGLAWGIF
jgi:hypothetical protein